MGSRLREAARQQGSKASRAEVSPCHTSTNWQTPKRLILGLPVSIALVLSLRRKLKLSCSPNYLKRDEIYNYSMYYPR